MKVINPKKSALILLFVFLIVGTLSVYGYCHYSNIEYIGYGIATQKNAYKPEPPLLIEAYWYFQGKILAKQLQDKLKITGTTQADLEKFALWIFRQNLDLELLKPVVEDNYLALLKRGFGFCDQTAHALAAIVTHAGFTARLNMLRLPNNVSPHTVAEVMIAEVVNSFETPTDLI